jgi:hypothetical protein
MDIDRTVKDSPGLTAVVSAIFEFLEEKPHASYAKYLPLNSWLLDKKTSSRILASYLLADVGMQNHCKPPGYDIQNEEK